MQPRSPDPAAPDDGTAVARDGTRIGFDVAGTVGGEPLVLLAGQANSRDWWGPIRTDLAGYRTIAVDTAGTGTSDDVRDADWSTRRFARDVVAVLDEIGVERAHVYGTSMGGRVAQWVAIDHPDRVGALVLGCTTGGGAGAVPPAPDVTSRLADPSTNRAELERLMVGVQYRWSHPGPLPVLGDDSMSAAARRGHRRASERHDAWDQLPGLACPTLVLHGTADELAPPENGVRLAERIPGARLELLQGAHHAYFLEYRAEASGLVRAFLGTHTGARVGRAADPGTGSDAVDQTR